MPASVITNWGKTYPQAVAFCGVDPDDQAPGANVYLILIDNTFPGFTGSNTDPDTENISAVTGGIAPANYSGNTRSRTKAAGGFTFTKDNTNDRAIVQFFENPVITAVNALTNVRGFALCTANSISTGKVICIQRFDATYSLSPSQTGTISGSQMLIT